MIYGNPSTPDPAFNASLDAYVLWKRQKGADVRVASTTTTGTSTSSIKTYLQNLYNDITTRPDFIIILGDVSGSYTIPTFTVSSGGGDYPYTHLAGTDGIGDVFIGRISVENISQLQILMNKIYLYERDIDLATADWLNRGLLVGDWDPSGISTVYINKYLKESALVVNPLYTFTESYNSNPSAAVSNTAINQGVGIFNYRGYIGMSGWSPGSSLINGYKLPHAIIITCSTGNFATGLGTTEAFIRLGTTASPAGAVTATGMSTSSTHTTFNNCLNGGMIAGMYQYGQRTMGEILLSGKVYMNQIFGVSSPTSVTNFTHWCNLMG
ncbi:MAG TPA: C25 family cysteine peptidase, partial [Candidatus Cloacimonadota bacterium]|nr:C25 family cysteine peptidase [Candidatus Cloacimonadota bacterium]